MSSPDALSTCEEARQAIAGIVVCLPRYVVEKPGGGVDYSDEVLQFTALGEGVFTYGSGRYRLVDLPARKVHCRPAYDFRLVPVQGGDEGH